MITTSEQFKISIKEPARRITGRLLFSGFGYDERYVQSITIETILTPEDFQLGIAAMSMATVEIEEDLYSGLYIAGNLTGQTCSIEIGLKLTDGTTEYLSMGRYTVETFEREQTKVRLKLVDNMHLLDQEYNPSKNIISQGMSYLMMETLTYEELENITYDSLESGLYPIMAPPVYPTTLYEIAKHAILQCGLTLDTESWANSDYVISNEPVYEGLSCRHIIAQIAELAGGYAVVNRNGNVEIITLGSIPVTNLTDADMFNYKEHEGNTGTIDRVIVKVGDEQASAGEGINIYTIVDNMFVQNPNNVVQALYEVLYTVGYYPVASMEWSGDFSLDVGDMLSINGKNTYILNRIMKVTGGLVETLESPVKSNTERNSTGKNNTQLDINRVKTSIKVVDGKIEQVITDTDGKISTINQEIGNINLAVADKASTAQINILAESIESKVTQEQVQDLIDEVNRANPNLVTNYSENWEQGNISSSNGIVSDSTNYIRTKTYFPIRQGHVYIKVSPLYQAMIVLYDSNYSFKASYGFSSEQTFLLDENCYFKVVLRRTNLTAIEPSAIDTAELKVENSDVATQWTAYMGDLTPGQQQEYFALEVKSNNGWTIDNDSFTATFTAKIYLFNDDVTSRFQPLQFTWYKQYPGGQLISLGNGTTKIITGASIEKSATISCAFEIYDTIYTLTTFNDDTLLTVANDEIMAIGYL